MINSTRKLLILLLAIMSMKTISFSQTILNSSKKDTIVSITSQQLKETNLIFAEHSKLLKENELLNRQLNNYKLDNSLLIKSDSIKSIQINSYKEWVNSLNKSLDVKHKKLRLWKISSVTIYPSLLILLLIK